MPEIMIQDPGSNEAESPLIAGITEGLNKISKILNLKTGTLTDEPLRNVAIAEDDKNRIYQANDGKRLWLATPTPTFKKNGSPITQEQAQFSIDYVGGSISFKNTNRLSDGDNVTVSCTYIVSESKTISDLIQNLSETSDVANKYKGSFVSLSELQGEHASAKNGDFAIVLDVGSIFIWKNTAWVNSQSIEDLSEYYTKQEINNLLSKKEPAIKEKGSSLDADDFYLGGRKTWQDLKLKVKSVPLNGISFLDKSQISGSDTVLTAFGKLQAQVSESTKKAYLEGSGAPTTSTEGKVGQRYVNTSNGDWYTCKESGLTFVWEQGQGKIDSLKNPNALTISLNGKSEGAYDGSAAKSINITPLSIGALGKSEKATDSALFDGHSWKEVEVSKVPAAGLKGQVLTKKSNSDNDVGWTSLEIPRAVTAEIDTTDAIPMPTDVVKVPLKISVQSANAGFTISDGTLVMPKSGTVVVAMQAMFIGAANTYMGMRLSRNTASVADYYEAFATLDFGCIASVPTVITVNANDKLTFYAARASEATGAKIANSQRTKIFVQYV